MKALFKIPKDAVVKVEKQKKRQRLPSSKASVNPKTSDKAESGR